MSCPRPQLDDTIFHAAVTSPSRKEVSVPDVIAYLRSGNPQQIKDALEFVAWTQNREIWREVVAAAAHPDSLDADPPAVLMAAGLIQHPDTAHAILRALQSNQNLTLPKIDQAIAALVSVGPDAIPVLVEAVRSADATTSPPAWASALALAQMGAIPVQQLSAILRGYQKATPAGRLLSVQALARISSRHAAEVLAEASQTIESGELRAVIARSMGWKDACIPALTRLALSDPDENVRRAAIEALGENGSPEASQSLARLANRPALDDSTRMLAINTLGGAGGDAAQTQLIDLLHDTELPPVLRLQAAINLGDYPDEVVVEALAEALRVERSSSAVYKGVIQALRQIGTDLALLSLQGYLDKHRDRDPGVTEAVESALSSWDEPQDQPDPAGRLRQVRRTFQQPEMRARAVANLAEKLGAEIVPYLRRMIGTPEDSVLALQALGRTRSLPALRPILRAAVSGSGDERAAAIRAFADIGPDSIHNLALAIQDTAPDSVGAMAETLSGFGMKGQAMLRGVLEGAGLPTQHALLRWMAESRADIPGLTRSAYHLATDPSQTPETRLLSWEAIAASTTRQVNESLRTALRGPSNLNFLGAARAYARRGDGGIYELAAFLAGDRPAGDRRRVVVSILGRTGSPAAWPAVRAEMDRTTEPASSLAAVRQAWRFGDQAVEELARLAAERPALASDAVESLGRIESAKAALALHTLSGQTGLDETVLGLARQAYSRLYRSLAPAPGSLPAPEREVDPHFGGDIDLSDVDI